MHAAAINLRGGVAPKTTCLRGQSIIEYVLIIAVIGLVIVYAGPGVAGAIRNQFNLVGNTVESGTGGDSFMNAEDKAYQEAMKTVVNKDAKDWTLDEQKAVAEDIAAKGEASPAYAKAKAAMDANTKWSIKLTNGKTLEYRIIGINHDDLADGSGKAGLTFETTNDVLYKHIWNDTKTNVGGWRSSKIRARLNSGDLWALLPAELQSKAKTVTKMTDNDGGGSAGTPSATIDKVFILSTTEIYGYRQSDGTQYEYYAMSRYSGPEIVCYFQTRSVSPSDSTDFFYVDPFGRCESGSANSAGNVFPAWCF